MNRFLKQHRKQILIIFSLLILVVAAVSISSTTVTAQELFPGESAALPGEETEADYRVYIKNFYQFSIGAGILIATVLIMIGGMIWATSAGNQTRIGKAKEYINNSVIGVILLMTAYVILQFINPKLVTLENPTPPSIGKYIPCIFPKASEEQIGNNVCKIEDIDDCKEQGGLPVLSKDEYEKVVGALGTGGADALKCSKYCPAIQNDNQPEPKKPITDGSCNYTG